jgi:hypothetical protein
MQSVGVEALKQVEEENLNKIGLFQKKQKTKTKTKNGLSTLTRYKILEPIQSK